VKDQTHVNVAEMVATAKAEADTAYAAAARCPNCDTPTQLVPVTKGTGADRWTELKGAWCLACLNAGIRARRDEGEPCSCDDPAHPHADLQRTSTPR
jgi:hypothetical protein